MKGGSSLGYPNSSVPSNSARGIKNNNPGNLRLSSSKWQGKIPQDKNTDGAFEQFESMMWGARAQMKNIITLAKRGNDTLAKLLHVYAPTNENDTEGYIKFLTKQLGVTRDHKITQNEFLIDLGFAMSKMENGVSKHITREHYVEAYSKL